MKICVLTNDNHLWLLNGFQYLWNKYCGLPVTIYGFKSPNNLQPNFEFVSLGKQLPASQWSNGLLKMLDLIEDNYFILMLEDFWLYEQITNLSKDVFYSLINFCSNEGSLFNNLLRVDLSGNRVAYKQHFEIGKIAHADMASGSGASYNIVETFSDCPYQMSFQAAIWHKENLRQVLRLDESPWQSEIEGSKRVTKRVLGTKPAVIKYQPVWQHSRWKLDKLKTEDINFLKRRGWLEIN